VVAGTTKTAIMTTSLILAAAIIASPAAIIDSHNSIE
jgi:hypothetical protein